MGIYRLYVYTGNSREWINSACEMQPITAEPSCFDEDTAKKLKRREVFYIGERHSGKLDAKEYIPLLYNPDQH